MRLNHRWLSLLFLLQLFIFHSPIAMVMVLMAVWGAAAAMMSARAVADTRKEARD